MKRCSPRTAGSDSPRPSDPKIEQRPRSSHRSSTQSCSRVCESPILPAGEEGMLASAELLLSRDEAVGRLPAGPAVTFQDKAGVLHHQQWWPLEMLFLAREGVLVESLRKGYWIILDELNLAPSESTIVYP
ncbi:conserved unknown protein [Ectocarpus siliculosus]|uniref:ATPase dynein-related AAA domain-containing protein n=1 Tax=Ectocarpus siliculosus TaxID=2880 RepID=D7FRC1_ECTSI|nr:conserved unknown protein [Ectocarpus siliculosus]|eukprot:CBJ30712.1 conserved unknown protein [Ectocarpus siliculosus]